MSADISITLPLSLFEGMSVEEAIENIKNFTEASEKINNEKARANSYRDTMLQWAGHLQSILDQDVDDFQKRQNLRQFANDTREFANQIERIYSK